MKQIIAHLTDEEKERCRELFTLLRAYESGSVKDASISEIQATYSADLQFWDKLTERYDLEEDENYEIDPVMGIVFVTPD